VEELTMNLAKYTCILCLVIYGCAPKPEPVARPEPVAKPVRIKQVYTGTYKPVTDRVKRSLENAEYQRRRRAENADRRREFDRRERRRR
jgi:hypothetical protein